MGRPGDDHTLRSIGGKIRPQLHTADSPDNFQNLAGHCRRPRETFGCGGWNSGDHAGAKGRMAGSRQRTETNAAGQRYGLDVLRSNKFSCVGWKFKGTKGNGLVPARSAAFTWSAMGRKSIPSRRRLIFAGPPKET